MTSLNTWASEIDWISLLKIAGRVAFILLLAWGILRVARSSLARLQARIVDRTRKEGDIASESTRRAATLTKLATQAAVLVVWLTALVMVLSQVGISVAPLIASAGIVGLAVGFGAQNLVRDMISGFFMLLENQVRVGDVAVVNGTSGLVERITFRTLVLRDLSGTMHVFPNGAITTLANRTMDWSAYVLDIGVSYGSDADTAMRVMQQVGAELRQDAQYAANVLEDIEIFGVDAFADSAVMIKGRIKTRPGQQWVVGREYLRRLKLAFDRENIEIPFPQRTLHMAGAALTR